jgi:ATP-dependent HslUV protease subunit HslV
MHGTTVLCVRKDNKVVLIADGQVTMGDHVMKHTARKTRRFRRLHGRCDYTF